MSAEFQIFTSLRYDPALVDVPDSAFSHASWNYKNRTPLYMLDFHRDRMLRAAAHWGWEAAAMILSGDSGLERLATFILQNIGTENQGVPLRVRVTVSKDGEMGVTTSQVPETPLANLFPEQLPHPGAASASDSDGHLPSKSPEYEVVIADLGTTRSEYTHFKTTKREMYDRARQRAHISLPDHKEVLILNEADGSIMEGSTTTPYLWRNERWVTPTVSKEYSPDIGSGGQDGTSRRWALERALAVESVVLAESLVDGEECWLSNGVRGFIFGRIELNS